MSSRDRDLIEHIVLAAHRLKRIADAGRDQLEASWMMRAKARAMRNFIAHDYDDIDRNLVWEAVCASVPDLAAEVSDLSDDTPDQPSAD
ncbi:DUF86 domain-containing protein [Candidatus Poriferisocius sp.]|uniref:HepT-like ribonuclease domain-containing protein n=1 Tax=Candidatus Poriferisocius sp. TaxID=3101276 RepID=UPI003B59518E